MRTNGEGKPVVALDIDGTLGDYHSNFLKFADLYFHSGCGSWHDMRENDNPGLPLWQWMGISHRDYRDAKLAYRQGGWKRWMPAYLGASELTQQIREVGAEVWLCTTRPYLRLDNVDPDTREWLQRNRIQYDALLFDPAHEEDGTKYDELKRQAGDRVASVVDDLPDMVTNAAGLGWHPILRDQPYNRHFKSFVEGAPVRRAHNLIEAYGFITEDLERWRSNR